MLMKEIKERVFYTIKEADFDSLGLKHVLSSPSGPAADARVVRTE